DPGKRITKAIYDETIDTTGSETIAAGWEVLGFRSPLSSATSRARRSLAGSLAPTGAALRTVGSPPALTAPSSLPGRAPGQWRGRRSRGSRGLAGPSA